MKGPVRSHPNCHVPFRVLASGLVLLLASPGGCPPGDGGPSGGDGAQSCVLTVTVSPAGAGQVVVEPAKAAYAVGERVSLAAQAASGYRFDHWQGDAAGADNPLVLTMHGDVTVEAVFVASGTSGGNGEVSPLVTVLPAGVTVQPTQDGRLSISGAGVPALYPGQVLVHSTGGAGGMLARVKSVTTSNGVSTVEFGPAGLTDVFRNAHIALDTRAIMAQAKAAPRKGIPTRSKGMFGFDIVENEDGTHALQLSQQDISLDITDDCTLTLKDLTFQFTPVLDVGVDIEDMNLTRFRCVGSGTMHMNLDVEVSSSAITDRLSKDFELAEVDFLRGVIPIGAFPLEYVCTFTLTLGVEVTFGDVGTVAGGFDLTTGLTAGAEYLHGSWTPVSDLRFDLNPHAPSISLAPVEVEVYAQPEIGVKFFETVGPSISVKDYVKLVGNLRSLDFPMGLELRRGDTVDFNANFDIVDLYKLSHSETLWENEYVMLARMVFGVDPGDRGSLTHTPDEFLPGTGLYSYVYPVTVDTQPEEGFETIGYRIDYLCENKSVVTAGNPLEDEPVNASKQITAIVVAEDPNRNADGSDPDSLTGPYHITTEMFPSDSGEVIVYPRKAGYRRGDKVIVRAKPYSGSKFHHWEAALEGTEPLMAMSVYGDMTVRAVFESIVPRQLYVPQAYATIQEAIDAATYGDRVVIDFGTYGGDGNRDLDFHGRHMILAGRSQEETIIDLGGSAAAPHRLADLTDVEGDVYIEHMTIRNGYAGRSALAGTPNNVGGAVIAGRKSNLYVTFCDFVNCHAPSHGGAIYFQDPYADFESSLRLCNSRFEGCTADDNGGAVYFRNPNRLASLDARFSQCIFRNNSGDWGGAIYCPEAYGDLRISDSEFTGNHATNQGGAAVVERVYHVAEIARCTFAGNSASLAGALYCEGDRAGGGGEIFVRSCQFLNNTATGYGGALSTGMVGYTSEPVTVEDCTFDGNSAPSAGAVYLAVSTTMRSSRFADNRATHGDAGAARIAGHASDCTFTGNHAADEGGAVQIDDTGIVDGSEFNANTAGWLGGAVLLSGGTLAGGRVENNEAKGAGGIFSSGGVIQNVVVHNNRTTERHSGGGIDARQTEIRNCTITSNQAILNGGGLDVNECLVAGCTISENTATENGGGIMMIESNVMGCSIFQNTAAEGGGVWVSGTSTESTIGGGTAIYANTPENCHAVRGDVCAGFD